MCPFTVFCFLDFWSFYVMNAPHSGANFVKINIQINFHMCCNVTTEIWLWSIRRPKIPSVIKKSLFNALMAVWAVISIKVYLLNVINGPHVLHTKNPTQFYGEYEFHITHYHTKIHITHKQGIPSRIQCPISTVLLLLLLRIITYYYYYVLLLLLLHYYYWGARWRSD